MPYPPEPMSFAVEFDFEQRIERAITVDRVKAACEQGLFVWVDVDVHADRAGAEAILRELDVNQHAIDEAVGPDVDGRYDLYDECLHIAVTSCRLREGQFESSHVDIVLGERFLVTLRRGEVEFIDAVKRQYKKDFYKFAKSPGFLLYEYWDYLIDSFKRTMRSFEVHVERLQKQIFSAADDSIFAEVSNVTNELLQFRKIMLAAREVLHELSTRRVVFVSESTQPFLESMAGTLERLSSDLGVEREILTETLNLYMGIVSHRTNKVVSRLTVISMVFLPLTFLCGVYGMNFDTEKGNMPELLWPHGYAAFWAITAAIAVSLLTFMKLKKWW